MNPAGILVSPDAGLEAPFADCRVQHGDEGAGGLRGCVLSAAAAGRQRQARGSSPAPSPRLPASLHLCATLCATLCAHQNTLQAAPRTLASLLRSSRSWGPWASPCLASAWATSASGR